MYKVTQSGPETGDRVQVESLGTIVGTEERRGVNGALVELDGNDNSVWVPLRFLTVVGLR
jgi:hypothetical protein